MFVVMGNCYDIKLGQWRSDSHALISAQELWFAVFMTVLYVVPVKLCNQYSQGTVSLFLGLPFERSLSRLKL